MGLGEAQFLDEVEDPWKGTAKEGWDWLTFMEPHNGSGTSYSPFHLIISTSL